MRKIITATAELNWMFLCCQSTDHSHQNLLYI